MLPQQGRPVDDKVWRRSRHEEEPGYGHVRAGHVAVCSQGSAHVVRREGHPHRLEVPACQIVVQTVGGSDVEAVPVDPRPKDVVTQVKAFLRSQQLLFLAAQL